MKYIVSVYTGSVWQKAFCPSGLKTAFSLASLDEIPSKLASVIDQGLLSPEEKEDKDFFFSVLLLQDDGKVEPVNHKDLTVGEYGFFLIDGEYWILIED